MSDYDQTPASCIDLEIDKLHSLISIHSFADPIDPAKRDLSLAAALERHQADPSLLYVDTSDLAALRATAWHAGDRSMIAIVDAAHLAAGHPNASGEFDSEFDA